MDVEAVNKYEIRTRQDGRYDLYAVYPDNVGDFHIKTRRSLRRLQRDVNRRLEEDRRRANARKYEPQVVYSVERPPL